MSGKKIIVGIIVIVLVLLSIWGLYLIEDDEKSRVKKEELKEYTQSYLKQYKEVTEDYFYEVSDDNHIFFVYNHGVTKIEGYVSRVRGVAVEWDYKKDENDSIFYTGHILDKSIEYQFWPNMAVYAENWKTWNIIRIIEGTYFLESKISIPRKNYLLLTKDGIIYYTGESKNPFQMAEKGLVRIDGKIVCKSGLIIKGTNTKHAWMPYQAKLDAIQTFLWDSKNELTENVRREIKKKYNKPLLLEKINKRIETEYYTKPEQFYTDLNKLEELGLSSQLKTSLFNNYQEMKEESSLFEKIPSFMKTIEFFIGIVASIIGIIIGLKKFGFIGNSKK